MSGPTEGNLNSTTPAAPSGKQNCVFQADASFTDPVTGLPERDISAYPQPATASLEGTIKLAGDLGGTADIPEVVGIEDPFEGSAPGDGYVPTFIAADTKLKWLSGGAIGSFAPFNNMLTPATVSPPVLASLTWGNQGSATAAANAGGALYVQDQPLLGTGDKIRFLYKSAPATPWTLTIGMALNLTQAGTSWAGLFLRESSSGKLIVFYVGADGSSGGNTDFGIAKFSSYTGFAANYFGTSSHTPPLIWLQVTNDGTNLTWKSAIDGQNFKQLLQKSKSDYFSSGPDEVGIGINPWITVNPTDALFVHWAGV